MVGNVLLDIAIGSIPVLGDLFDAGFKANTRNVRLLHPYGHPSALDSSAENAPGVHSTDRGRAVTGVDAGFYRLHHGRSVAFWFLNAFARRRKCELPANRNTLTERTHPREVTRAPASSANRPLFGLAQAS